MKRVLVIAYHFPPCTGSSGLLRAEKFVRYLPDFGWEPFVLAPHPRAYDSTDFNSSARIKARVFRSFALDTKRHLSFKRSYFDWMALPDRWITWCIGAIPLGLRLIRRQKIDVLFSTFPISTAILIGLILHKLTGLPWIVDLRDSMTEEHYPKDARERRIRRWIERRAMRYAFRVIFTAESTRRMYLERYPNLAPDKCRLISNGFDEEDFVLLRQNPPNEAGSVRPLRLAHNGAIYPEERDPIPFFRALSRLKREGSISSATLSVSLRATGADSIFQDVLDKLGLSDIVQLLPHIPYRDALQECADSDGLLLLQAANCDHQIPAKAYEYLRLGKPILALTTHTGDTAALLNDVGGATILQLADEQDIYNGLPRFLFAVSRGQHPKPRIEDAQRYSRRSQSAQLAELLSSSCNQERLASAVANGSLTNRA